MEHGAGGHPVHVRAQGLGKGEVKTILACLRTHGSDMDFYVIKQELKAAGLCVQGFLTIGSDMLVKVWLEGVSSNLKVSSFTFKFGLGTYVAIILYL